jgi:hypothetical protein
MMNERGYELFVEREVEESLVVALFCLLFFYVLCLCGIFILFVCMLHAAGCHLSSVIFHGVFLNSCVRGIQCIK